MFGFNGLAVVGSLGYGQGPLTAHNVTIQGNTFRNCQYPCSIKNGTAATGSNVKVLNNTFLDTSSDPNQGSNGTALVLNSVSGATISGNFFDRNWGANVSCEYDQNLTITGNTFSHPNFIRPPLAGAYTGQYDGNQGLIVADPSSVVYLADDSGVTLSGNLVSGAGPYTQQLVEAATGVTGATGLTSGVTQIDAPLVFYLGYDGLVMDQPATGSVLDQATWTGGNTQKWITTPAPAAPGYATLTDSSNGQFVGNAGSTATGANIVQETPAYASGTSNPAADQLWDFGAIDQNTVNILNDLSGYAVNVLYGATYPGAGLCQYTPGNAPNQDFYTLVPPAPVAQAGLENVALTWAPVPYASQYNVARATAPGGTYTNIATNLTGDTYTDTTVTPGTTYYYQVVALGPPLSNNGSAPVAARAGATFTGVPVNLAPAFNAAAIQPDGWTYLGGGFDGYGYAYSSNLLGLGACGGSLAWARRPVHPRPPRAPRLRRRRRAADRPAERQLRQPAHPRQLPGQRPHQHRHVQADPDVHGREQHGPVPGHDQLVRHGEPERRVQRGHAQLPGLRQWDPVDADRLRPRLPGRH